MSQSSPPLAGLCAAALLALAGCDRPAPEIPAETSGSTAAEVSAGAPEAMPAEISPEMSAEAPADVSAGVAPTEPAAALPADTLGDDSSLGALIDENEIPYPVYPNGAKYRIGGENGLKIVLFETEDSFDEVDAYYSQRTDEAGMPRLAGMNDYVRYAKNGDDADPWATDRPGIVIHRFDEGEREAVGAGKTARTNIIMSF